MQHIVSLVKKIIFGLFGCFLVFGNAYGSTLLTTNLIATDTVRTTLKACDSLYLPTTDSTYRVSTKFIYSPTSEGGTIDSVTIYTLLIGTSLHLRDTVIQKICANNLPFTYGNRQLTSSGDYVFNYRNIGGCDSLTRVLRLLVLNNEQDTVHLSVCSNDFPYRYSATTQFNAPGTSSISQSNDANGCPIITTFVVTQIPSYRDTIVRNICAVDTPYIAFDTTFSITGTYTHHYQTINQCDSDLTLQLYVHPTYHFTDTLITTICSHDLPYQYGDSSFYHAGTFDFPIRTVAGCDSMQVHLELTVTATHYDTIVNTLCSNEFPFQYNGVSYPSAGTYDIIHDDDLECHNVTKLILNQLQAYNDTVRANVCVNDLPYVFADSNFTQSTVYTWQDTTSYGCDSLTTLILNVNPNYDVSSTLDLSVCRSELPYYFHGDTLTTDSSKIYHFQTQSGCDSATVLLNFTIHENPKDSVEISLCANDFPYQYGQLHFDTAGTYDVLIPDTVINGCDTMRHLILNSKPVYHDSISAMICANESYLIGDSTLTSAGIYDITLVSSQGCDSMVTVTIGTYPTYSSDTVNLTVCENHFPLFYHNVEFTTAGIHQIAYTTIHGCDSMEYINIVMLPTLYNRDTILREICANELPYTAYGRTLYAAGVFTYQTSSLVSGCDSIFYVKLIVHNNPTPAIVGNNYLCAGTTSNLTVYPAYSTYTWNNGFNAQLMSINLAGLYSVTVTDEYGCSATASKTVTAAALPIIQFSGNQTICYGDSTIITVIGGTSYQWSIGKTTASVILRPSTTTTYQVTVTNATPCSSTGSFSITVNSLPNPVISGTAVICQGDSTQLYVTGGSSYLWSNQQVSDHITVKDAGSYTVTATNSLGCHKSISQILTVNERPSMHINGRTSFCQGTSTTLSASGAQSYEWASSETTQTITTSIVGSYTVTGTASNGCTSTASVNLTAIALPNITFSGNNTICTGQSTTLTANGGSSYQWGDGNTSASITVAPTVTATYAVTASNVQGCTATRSITVVVNSLPSVSITGNTSICTGETATLSVTGGQSYIWSNSSTANDITVTAAGTYRVTATDINGCSNTASILVAVYALPTIRINGRQEFCQGSTNTLTATGASTYEWNSGETTSSITTGIIGTYTVTGTSTHGCASSASIQIYNSQINATISGNRAFCQGSSTTLTVTSTSSNAYTYRWFDGSSTNSVVVSSAGQYTVTVTNTLGCTNTITANVNTYDLPSPSIAGTLTICQGRTTTLRASGGISYIWDDGSTQAYLNVSTTGTYYVTVSNANGCTATTGTTVFVNPLPNVTLMTSNNICQGANVSIYASCPTGTSYSWTNGQSTQLISVTPNTTTTYTVLVTDLNGCSNTAATTITVNTLPVPFINGASSLCQGDSTHLTAQGGSSYQWSNGLNTATITVHTGGAYSVTVTNAAGCSATTSISLTSNAVPEVTINANAIICQGGTATLTAASTNGNTYRWSNGSYQSTLTISTAGTYTVTVTSAGGCTASATTTIISRPLPPLSFGGQHSICNGQSYTYTLPTDSTLTYRWSNNATGNQITAYVSGYYSVTATNTFGCTRSATDTLIVHALPTPVITGTTSICRGSYTILTASGGNSYLWSNGSNTADIAVYPTTNTNYSVTMTNTYGCTATTSTLVTIKVLPSIIFSGNHSFCQGGSTTISVTGGSSYQWGNGSTTSTQTFSAAGTYRVTATNSYNCQKSDSILITVNPLPNITVSGNNPICAGNSDVLTASGATSYVWNTNETGATITVMPTSTTSYTVTGTNINGCTASVSKVVNVQALPNIQISGILTLCQGSSTTLTATNGSSYVWSNGNIGSTIQVSEGGNYTVTGTATNGCSASALASVIINPTPTASISGASTLCDNTTTTLTATGGTHYLWSNNHTTSTITVSSSGTYTVTISNDYGCNATTSMSVTALSAPFLNIIGSHEICAGGAVTLTASSNASQFVWSTGAASQIITVTPPATTTYIVTATGNNGCSTKDSITVTMFPVYQHNVSDAICQGSTYSGHGFNLPIQSTAGTLIYKDTLQTVHGCDSILTLILTVNPLPIMPDTISGSPQITANGTFYYSVIGASYVNNYEWFISNTHWTLSNSNINNVFLTINTNGNGILTARGINSCGYTERTLNIYCNVSVDEYLNTLTNILIYPNPVRNTLHVNLEKATRSVKSVQLYDYLGRCLQTIPADDNQLNIDCSQYAAGNYFVRIIDNDGKLIDTRKIIIQK